VADEGRLEVARQRCCGLAAHVHLAACAGDHFAGQEVVEEEVVAAVCEAASVDVDRELCVRPGYLRTWSF